jgi:hypothetical protein
MLLAATGFLVGSRAVDEQAIPPLSAVAKHAPTTAMESASRGASVPMGAGQHVPTGHHVPTTAKASASPRISRPSTQLKPARGRKTGMQAASRRFAWAPSHGASGYHIELFRGSALIFRAQMTKPEILIRRRWRFNGRDHQLEPGAYRWYVWPLVDGRRRAKAIVQAKLAVPG